MFSLLFLLVTLNSYLVFACDTPDCHCAHSCDGHDDETVQLKNDNIPPICHTGPDLILQYSSPESTLNARGSSDPDEKPEKLGFYWAILETPYSPSEPPFKIENPSSPENTIHSHHLVEGEYKFVLYVSDGQSITHCLWKVSIFPPLPTLGREFNFVYVMDPDDITEGLRDGVKWEVYDSPYEETKSGEIDEL